MATKLFIAQFGVTGDTVYSGAMLNVDGSQRTIFCWGTFGRGSVYVEYSPDGINWFRDRTDESTFWENDLRTLRPAAGIWIRGAFVNPLDPSSINLWVF
jgi:hypothetical protein